jgi:acetyl esterase/lipase
VESKVFNKILKYSALKKSLEKAFETGEFGEKDINEPPKKLFSEDQIEKRQIYGKNIFTLKAKNGSSGKTIFYLHGGAYIQGFSMIHWIFLKHLLHATKCTIIAPDYPLAPNFTYIDSYKMVKPIYKELISKAGGENVILMGDSS